MCGFTGFWSFRENKASFLKETALNMSKLIEARGPDAHGVWVSEGDGMAFAHRRLSVIDLSQNGQQPMLSHNKRFYLCYNGEIYNSESLKAELIRDGGQFRGHSDTEVLLEACCLWGIEKTLIKSNGMFAFALWDNLEKRLFLARDRLGIKPLYWGFNQGILYFGSQVGTFTRHPSWLTCIDRQALASYFAHNYIRQPNSIYKGIKQLKPGQIIQINHDKSIKDRMYWSLEQVIENSDIQNDKSEEELLIELEHRLKSSIRSRMVADVPLGAFLSGGIDSSMVVAIMQSLSNQPIKTFSIGFKESDFNEAEHAKKVANYLGTEHHEHYFGADDAIRLIPNLASWYDEPFADSSQLPTYLVSSLASKYVTVCLSGDGGDELFAGYNRYKLTNRYLSKLDYIPKSIAKTIGRGIENIKPAYIERLLNLVPQKVKPRLLIDKVYKAASILQVDRNEVYRRLVSVWPDNVSVVNGERYTTQLPNCSLLLDDVSRMQYSDTVMYLPDDILTKVDRASMAVSLEVRVPLLDYRLVEFAWSLPMKYKLQKNQGKILLTRLLNQYLPKNLVDRPKMGFGVPIGDWLRGPLREWAEDLLSQKSLNESGLLNANLIRSSWLDHVSGRRNLEYSLWGGLMFQEWYRKWC